MEEQMDVENVKDDNGKDEGMMKKLNGEKKTQPILVYVLLQIWFATHASFSLQTVYNLPVMKDIFPQA